MAETAVVFQTAEEFEKARRALQDAGAAYRAVRPPDEVADVAVPLLVLPDASRGALHQAVRAGVMMAGQVPYREPAEDALAGLPPAPAHADDVVGRITIAFVGPCIATEEEIRATAQVQGDLAPAMPYLNADLPAGTYGPEGPTFTFMDGQRLVNLLPHRIATSRCREMVDAWRTLTKVKRTVLDVWSRRGQIRPSTRRRAPVTVLEIYQRLPRTNCGACGEATCMAFAAKLLAGEARLQDCRPAFDGEYTHLKERILEVAARLGMEATTG